ncbi:MAG: ATP-binding cassette domain-containing protein, partial [Actinomycetota bacterium]|nr:ATP-binding cassette domain-containing protein [Actinomycetota bacterium]
MSTPPRTRLEAQDVCVHFDGLKAIDQVDFSIEQNEIVGLIGPNGAGKTTLLNVLSGFQVPTTGKLRLGGDDATGRSPNWLARRGVARTFQSVRLFPTMTVFENVELGAIGVGASRAEARKVADRALDALGMTHRADLPARSLPHGEERLAGVARALAVDPQFLLLDEPGA